VLQACDRVGIDQAWISHLPSVFWRDPAAGNTWLYETAQRQERFRPIPAIHPGLSGWTEELQVAAGQAAPAVRCDPMYYGLDPSGPELTALLHACAEAGLPLLLAVRLEDARQRHPNDRAGELPPWAVRNLIRSHSSAQLIVTHADRGFVEEVHFGSTPEEAARIWWDICWIWGPPEDHLELLLGTVGVERFLFGTGQPLRIPETSMAKLDLLNLSSDQRAAIESKNAEAVGALPSRAGR
jgi:predicted TIM-barrel fold metal-dependent hydrolase